MSTLMLDFNNLSIITIFGDKDMINNPSPDWSLHKDKILNSIFYNIRQYKPTEVILAVDDITNWRKKIYPEYKAHRKAKKDNDIFPWDEYGKYIKSFLEEIKATFPFYVLQVPYAEGDDVIGVLAKHITNEKIIITADGDYVQLLSQPKVRIFNPLRQKFVTNNNPKMALMVKILAGDVSDNIPNVKPRLGPKTAEKLIINNEVDSYIKDNKLEENFTRNTRLVDWNYIPNVLQSKIIESYSKYRLNENINNNELFKFMVKHHLRNHLENISTIKQILKPLNDVMMNKDFLNFCEEN